MKNQTITRDGLKEIYDVACGGWKPKIEEYAKRNPFDSSVSFTQAEVDEMIRVSDAKQLKVLRKYFSIPKDIRDKVKSFADACGVIGIDPKSVYLDSDSKIIVAFKKLIVIIQALNEGWYPNWENENEYKYWNYFRMKGGFSYSITYYFNTYTDVPSALCLKSNELAIHAAEIALDEYKDYYS